LLSADGTISPVILFDLLRTLQAHAEVATWEDNAGLGICKANYTRHCFFLLALYLLFSYLSIVCSEIVGTISISRINFEDFVDVKLDGEVLGFIEGFVAEDGAHIRLTNSLVKVVSSFCKK